MRDAEYRLNWNHLVALDLLRRRPDRTIVGKRAWAEACSAGAHPEGHEINLWCYYRAIGRMPDTLITRRRRHPAWQYQLTPLGDEVLAGRRKVWLWRLGPYEGPQHLERHLAGQ
jgi:hypothetical protein